MKHDEFLKLCARKVAQYETAREDINVHIDRDDVYTVWACKTLQNSKCLMSATHSGALYYEFTLDGSNQRIYMDVYKKVENIPLSFNGEKLTNIPKYKGV